MQYIFYTLAFFAILCALFVVFEKNPVHSVLYLILTFFSIAVIYVLLNAQFLFIVQLIVYSGAIMVLFLFVLMLLNLNKDTEPQKSVIFKTAGAIAAGSFLLVLVAVLKDTQQSTELSAMTDIGLVKQLGKTLFTKFVVPFEVASTLFLAAMVGSVLLGKKELY